MRKNPITMAENTPIIPSQHPAIAMEYLIREHGILVLDDITFTPVVGESFDTPLFQIIICHEGYIKNYYDDKPDLFQKHDMCILYPKHMLYTEEISPDYNATIIAIAPEYAKDAGLSAPFRNSVQFQVFPSFHLTDEQYEQVMTAVQMLRILSSLELGNRREMMRNQLEILANMIDSYHGEALSPKEVSYTRNQDKAIQFLNDVVKYYTVSREVSFYAERLCLSPKHFGAIIREATGINPGDWISRYVINAAKTLLTTRLDLSIQQICDMLGFKEQTAFSRYFRRETGTTPKDFRKANKRI